MNTRFKFNQDSLRRLPAAPAGQRTMYHDTQYHYLKCRVTDAGKKSVLIGAKINGKSVKKNLCQIYGDDRDWSITLIRERARDLFNLLHETVGVPEDREIPTFGEFAEKWGSSASMLSIQPSTRRTKIRTAEIHCESIWKVPLDRVSRGDVRSIFTNLLKANRPRTILSVRTVINQIYELAVDEEVLPEDFVAPLPRKFSVPRGRRDRKLSPDERRRLLIELKNYQGTCKVETAGFRLAILVALLTGQRRGNVLRMRWKQLDNIDRVWRIPAEETKTRRPYEVVICASLWELLGHHKRFLLQHGSSGPWVFPSVRSPGQPVQDVKHAWAWLCREATLKDLRLHDLRHSTASMVYDELGDLKAAQLLLQHADIRTTANRYVHADELESQRRATEAVEAVVLRSSSGDLPGLMEVVFGRLDDAGGDRHEVA